MYFYKGGIVDIICNSTDLLVFSHLRWDFVFQRPQHLMSRFAIFRRVYFFEEPIFGISETPRLHIRESQEGVQVVVPHLPHGLTPAAQELALTRLVNELIDEESFQEYSVWYYTPMALPFSRHLKPNVVLYDCMDELSLFKGCPPAMIELEKELFKKADVIFTGGQALFEAKQDRHHNIHPAPSSIDYDHFSQGRNDVADPQDQAAIPHPRLGFFGVVDERMNTELLAEIAALRPRWHFVVIGPVVKIDPATLPKAANIHYLGQKDYKELPHYLAGWDCALMPFALNESTRFISPTKTPEYLAAGRPVVSTSIRDVVRPYAHKRLVHIADTPADFVKAAESAMKESLDQEWVRRVDDFLSDMSWDNTWKRMAHHEYSITKKRSQQAQYQNSLRHSKEFFPAGAQ
jgi:UDP-galactopyranose mutase